MNISPIMIFGLTSVVFGTIVYLFIKYSSKVRKKLNLESHKKVIPRVNIESAFSLLAVVLIAMAGIFLTPWMINFSESIEKFLLLKFLSVVSIVFISMGIFIHRIGIKEWEEQDD